MRVVLDTNVLASGVLDRKTPPSRIVALWRHAAFEHLTSAAIIEELGRTLENDYFRAMVARSEAAAMLVLVQTESSIVELSPDLTGVATHPEDDLILATAVAGHADYLVTGDRQLLALEAYEGVRIVNPGEFLVLLAAALDES